MIQVTRNVYVESDIEACNLGVVTTKEGIVMIDTPGNPSVAMKWREELSKMGQVQYVINTEEHPDHCTNSWFYPGVLITSQITREKLSKVPADQIKERARRVDPEVSSVMESFQLRLADITFDESLSLYLGEHAFNLFALPGHSAGGIGVYIPQEGVVFATDCVFYRVKSWLQEAEPDRWLESLRKLGELDVDIIVPGHGGICKKEYLDEQASIIRQWVEVVKSAIKQGLSVDEAKAEIASPDPYPKQSQITFISEEELNKRIIARLYQLYSG